jgi:hypothetical protein
MAKRKKQSKLPKRAKLRRGNSAKRGKPRKVAKSAAAKRTIAKPKPAPAKKVARKGRLPVGPAVEAVAAEVIQQPAATEEASTSPGVT